MTIENNDLLVVERAGSLYKGPVSDIKAPDQVGFISRGSSTSISPSSWTTIVFDTIDLDTDNAFDGTRFVAPSAGIYEINAVLVFTEVQDGKKFIIGSSVNDDIANVYVINRGIAGGTGWAGGGGAYRVQLNSGDDVRIHAFVGNSTPLADRTNYNTFSIFKR